MYVGTVHWTSHIVYCGALNMYWVLWIDQMLYCALEKMHLINNIVATYFCLCWICFSSVVISWTVNVKVRVMSWESNRYPTVLCCWYVHFFYDRWHPPECESEAVSCRWSVLQTLLICCSFALLIVNPSQDAANAANAKYGRFQNVILQGMHANNAITSLKCPGTPCTGRTLVYTYMWVMGAKFCTFIMCLWF